MVSVKWWLEEWRLSCWIVPVNFVFSDGSIPANGVSSHAESKITIDYVNFADYQACRNQSDETSKVGKAKGQGAKS